MKSKNKLKESPSDPRKQTFAAWILIALVFAFYLWTFVPCRGLSSSRFYNMLTDGFLSGKTCFLEEPPPELLALKDPYDPSQNEPYKRFHDASLFKGKYYLYFGPVPALVLFLPAKALLGIEVPQDVATVIFLGAGLISSAFFFRWLTRTIHPNVPGWIWLVSIPVLGLCTGAPFLLRRPEVYEVAISAGYFFAITGLYLTVSGIFGSASGYWKMTLGSLCCGLAIGARPSYVILCPLLLVGAVGWVRLKCVKLFSREGFSGSAAILVPCALCVLGLLAYNYCRFQNPLEFGSSFQLLSIHPKTNKLFRPDLFFSRLSGYLFYPYHLDGSAPFAHLLNGTFLVEPEAGTLLINPFLLIIPVWLFALRKTPKPQARSPFFIFMLFGTGPVMVLFLSLIAHPAVRYHRDFEGFLVLASLYAWCDLSMRVLRDKPSKDLLNLSAVGLMAYSCLIAAAFCVNEISPTAIRSYYKGCDLAKANQPEAAIEKYHEAIKVEPNFILAQDKLAVLLASKGKGDEAVPHFVSAIHTFMEVNSVRSNITYMCPFQGLAIYNPFAEYLKFADTLIAKGQTEAAVKAMDGLANEMLFFGFPPQALAGNVMGIASMIKNSGHAELAVRLESRAIDYAKFQSPRR